MENKFGLSKREFFSVMALQGLLSIPCWADHMLGCDGDENLTDEAVSLADDLIRSLKSKEEY